MTPAARSIAASVPLVLHLWLPAVAEQVRWAVPDADARLRLSVSGDLFAREHAELEAVIDFNAVLGAHRVLAHDSLQLLRADTGAAVELELAQDAQIRYASGNPILRCRWRTAGPAALGERIWELYFRTCESAALGAWQTLQDSFLPDSRQQSNALFSTSFEEADTRRPEHPAGFVPVGIDKPGEESDRAWARDSAHSGERCLKIARRLTGTRPVNSNHPSWRLWPPLAEIRPGETYRLSAWVTCVEVPPRAGATLTLVFLDQDKARVLTDRIKLQTGSAAHEWRYLCGAATAPAEARYAEVMFCLYGEGEVRCDDLAVSVVSGSVLPELPLSVGKLERRRDVVARPESTGDESRKLLACGVADEPPRIDGVLDEACWQTAGRSSDFEAFFKIPGLDVTTTVLACADRDALYFGFECTEPSTAALIADADQRDGRVWSDDSVELFLDTNLDGRSFYQIIVNPKGVFFDQDTGVPGLAGAKWDGPVSAAGRVRSDGWTVELRLGFSGLRLAEASGGLWHANFARSCHRNGRSCFSWVKVQKGFGEPDRFGKLVLPFDPSANAVTGKPSGGERVFWGHGELPFQITNRREQAVEVRVVLERLFEQRRELLGEATLTVGARETAAARVGCTLPGAGQAQLSYQLIEQPGEQLLYATSVTHTVPTPLEVDVASLVSYLSDTSCGGTWTVGLSPASAAAAELNLRITQAEADASLAREVLEAGAGSGSFSLDVHTLPAGAYRLHAELVLDEDVLARQTTSFVRVPGPFCQ